MRRHKVTFVPQSLTVEVPEDFTLMDAMHEAGVYFDFPCGGGKKCGKCSVRIYTDNVTGEGQDVSIRLACLTKVTEDLTVEFISQRYKHLQILSVSLERNVRVNPFVKKRYVRVNPPSLTDNSSDWRRILNGTFHNEEKHSDSPPPLSVLRQLPAILRTTSYQVTSVIQNNQIHGIEAGDTSNVLLGMAFDIGTTSIVGYLLDLYSGVQLAVVSELNPQTQFGADVISRIMYAGQEGGLKKLQTAVIQVLNALISEAVTKVGVIKEDIYALSVVGNTTMHHLFLGINPHQIAFAPHVSAVSDPLVLDAAELKINVNQAGKVYVLPNIAGFIGADTVAVLLATDLARSQNVKLIIDIGTNGEIVLGSSKEMVSCSTAAGPAFEGAQISCGMRGTTGAIDYITFQDAFTYSVIGGGKPQGICGSALLDVVAGLLKLGLIDRRGRFVPPERVTKPEALLYKHRLTRYDGSWAFIITEDTDDGNTLMITQRDIRELQMAKGAIATGIKVLTDKIGVDINEIQEVLLAGAFGNYMNADSACTIGLIPIELKDKIKMIGNAAGAGAKLALLSSSEFMRAAVLAKSVEYVELGVQPEFMKQYAESMYF